jgi:hypothetical protein
MDQAGLFHVKSTFAQFPLCWRPRPYFCRRSKLAEATRKSEPSLAIATNCRPDLLFNGFAGPGWVGRSKLSLFSMNIEE